MKWKKVNGCDEILELYVRIKLTDGSELNAWAQGDGDYWIPILGIFVTPDKVTHWTKWEQTE